MMCRVLSAWFWSAIASDKSRTMQCFHWYCVAIRSETGARTTCMWKTCMSAHNQRRSCTTNKASLNIAHGEAVRAEIRKVVDCGEDESSFSALKHLMKYFTHNKVLHRTLVLDMLNLAITEHSMLSNVLRVDRSKRNACEESVFDGSVTIAGDTHGQYEDFAQIFEYPDIGGYPSAQNQFVFNGDIVDRGPKAVEILMTLLFAKLQNPTSVHILRGNHEDRMCTDNFGFRKEVLRKYDFEVYDKFLAFFDTLPIAAVVENSVFVVHGGIGRYSADASIEDINSQDRFNYHSSFLEEMLWADPHPTEQGLRRSGHRGTVFGSDITKAFLLKNKLQCLVRSHEMRIGGYDVMHDGKCITVFSAPNYCGRMGNLGAVVRFDKPDSMEPTFVTFKAAIKINW